jgi:hypothetical protein
MASLLAAGEVIPLWNSSMQLYSPHPQPLLLI